MRNFFALVAGVLIVGSSLTLAKQNVSSTAMVSPASNLTTWKCGLNSIAATLTQCQAAPAAGLKLYVTDLVVQTTTTTSGTYGLQTGTGANCVTGTAALFPVSGTANRFNAPITTQGASFYHFLTPIDAPAASAICMIGTATNTVSIQLQGFIAP